LVEAALAQLDEVCSRVARPEHFTNHLHCDECFAADEFFLGHTPVSLGKVADPPETLPLAFLSPAGFRYMLPALVRMLAKDCQAWDLLMHFETRLDTLSRDEAAALRDVLYALYDLRAGEFHRGFFAYETLWRVLDRLDLRVR
jgi:hypothetical protein